MEAKIDGVKYGASAHFNPDVSVIIFGLHSEEGENVMSLVQNLLREGLQWECSRGVVALG